MEGGFRKGKKPKQAQGDPDETGYGNTEKGAEELESIRLGMNRNFRRSSPFAKRRRCTEGAHADRPPPSFLHCIDQDYGQIHPIH